MTMKLNKQKLIAIFHSKEFAFEVPYLYQQLFLRKFPSFARGYFLDSSEKIIYVDYDLSSSDSESWSLVIEITNDSFNIKFDDDDGMAKWVIQELKNSKKTVWKKLK